MVPTEHVLVPGLYSSRPCEKHEQAEPRRVVGEGGRTNPARSFVSPPAMSVCLSVCLPPLVPIEAIFSPSRLVTWQEEDVNNVVVGGGGGRGSDCKYGGLAAIAGETRSRSAQRRTILLSFERQSSKGQIHKINTSAVELDGAEGDVGEPRRRRTPGRKRPLR